ncbi:MAG: hypothetical protein ACSHYB_15520 [Roseibacillus sp.]
MMGLTNNLRIFLVIEACDMRKSFNGLAAIAEELKPDDLKSGVNEKGQTSFRPLLERGQTPFRPSIICLSNYDGPTTTVQLRRWSNYDDELFASAQTFCRLARAMNS